MSLLLMMNIGGSRSSSSSRVNTTMRNRQEGLIEIDDSKKVLIINS